MTEIGRIESMQKMACPSCRNIIDPSDIGSVLEGNTIQCAFCGQKIKLPEEIAEKIRQSKYVGTNLDITC